MTQRFIIESMVNTNFYITYERMLQTDNWPRVQLHTFQKLLILMEEKLLLVTISHKEGEGPVIKVKG